jgi:DNA invertase Pin-like site-specific DNA recombinase
MATFGYARTSTRDQEAGLQAQIRDLIAAGCAERDIYTEQASSVRGRGKTRRRRWTARCVFRR